MATTDLKTRRKEILAKLSAGQKLIHRSSWANGTVDFNAIEADDGKKGSDSYTHISKKDYDWLFGSGYIKQTNYEYGGRTTYVITEAGKNRLEEM